MKKTIIYIILAVVVAACTHFEDSRDSRAIVFRAVLESDTCRTKVTPTRETDLKSLPLGLVAFTHKHRATPRSKWVLLPETTGAVEVRYNQSHAADDPGKWVPLSQIHWPGKEEFIRFFAYAPHGALTIATSGVSSSGIPAPYIDYTVPTNLDEQKDILVAATDAFHDNPTMDKIDVPLTFSHALAGLRFRVQTGTRIKYVKVSGIYGKGIFDAEEEWIVDNNQTFEYIIGQETSDAVLAIEPYEDEAGVIDSNYSILTLDQTLLVLPQDIPETAYIEAVVIEGSGATAKERKVSGNIGGGQWFKGHIYIYDITGPLSLVVAYTERYLKGDDLPLR